MTINLDMTKGNFVQKIIKALVSLRRKCQFLDNVIKILYLNKTVNIKSVNSQVPFNNFCGKLRKLNNSLFRLFLSKSSTTFCFFKSTLS